MATDLSSLAKKYGGNIKQKPEGAQGLLPMAGGIVGSIAGSFIEPGLGTIAGGALGQGLGEWVRQLIDKQPTDVGGIVKQGVIGGAFSALPGAEETLGITAGTRTAEEIAAGVAAKTGAGFIKKAAFRSAAGTGLGAGTSLLETQGTQDDMATRLKKAVAAGETGSWSFPIFGAAADSALSLGTNTLQFLGKRIPGDLYDVALTQPKDAAQTIIKATQEATVGWGNSDYAVEKGIIPDAKIIENPKTGISVQGAGITKETLNNAFGYLDKNNVRVPGKVEILQQQVESNLQKELSDLFVDAKSSGLVDLIKGIDTKMPFPRQALALKDQIINLLQKNGINAYSSADFLQLEGKIPLTLVNEVKRVVGGSYKLDGVPEVYSSLKQFIENNAAGAGKDISALNNEASRLIDMKNFYEKNWQGKGSLPENLSPQAIAKSILEVGKGRTDSLNAMTQSLAMLGYTGIGGVMKGAGGAAMGVGAVFGLRSVLNSILNAALDNPESKIKAAKLLTDMFGRTADIGEKTTIMETMRQLGVKIPMSLIDATRHAGPEVMLNKKK